MLMDFPDEEKKTQNSETFFLLFWLCVPTLNLRWRGDSEVELQNLSFKDVSGRLHPYRVNSEEHVVRSSLGGTSCPQSVSVTSAHLSHISTLTSLWFIFDPQSRSTEPKQSRPNSFTLHIQHIYVHTVGQSNSDVRQRWSIWRSLRHLTPTLKTEPSVKNPLYSVTFVLCWGATRL